jgi:hypothetical protein
MMVRQAVLGGRRDGGQASRGNATQFARITRISVNNFVNNFL